MTPESLRKLSNIINEAMETGITDAWFEKGGFDTFKRPAVERYTVAQEPGTVDTLEGPVKYDAGHYIMTGPKGEQYPITPEKFREYKDDMGDGTCTPKKIHKQAKLADHDGSVVLQYNGQSLAYNAGEDYIVRHGAGDYGVVKRDIFQQTYDTSKV